jgi:uncharacterized protein YbjT (DUF2867 family)
MRVVVFGASGGVGSRAVGLLVAGGHDVVGVVRRPEAAADLEAAGAAAVVADVVDSDLEPVLAGADAVVWALGARFAADGPDGAVRIDGAGAQRAIAAAEAVGVPRWVQVSSLMADRPESGPPFLLPFLTAKGAADSALLAGPMTVTVLRPSGLSDDPGQGTVLAAEHLTPDDWGGDRSPMVSRQDVAALAVACAVDGLGAGRAYDIVSGSTPLADALA